MEAEKSEEILDGGLPPDINLQESHEFKPTLFQSIGHHYKLSLNMRNHKQANNTDFSEG